MGIHPRPVSRRMALLAVAAVVLCGGASLASWAATTPHAGTPLGQRAVGPGPIRTTLHRAGYAVAIRFAPNDTSKIGAVLVHVSRAGRAVDVRSIRLATVMQTMRMGYTGTLTRTGAGVYAHAWPPLGMAGAWRLAFTIRPRSGQTFGVALTDTVGQP